MADELSFEEAMKRLEETVRRLEAGNLTLEQAIGLFEEGTRLAQLCNEQLDAAELRVSRLVQTPSGSWVEAEFGSEAQEPRSDGATAEG